VTGFDGIELCAFTSPPLTTVRQDAGAMGAEAVEALLDMIGGAQAPPPVMLPAEVVVRASTAGPRA
jgi:DNA-binding LacI/PurR family transcriptional regulator